MKSFTGLVGRVARALGLVLVSLIVLVALIVAGIGIAKAGASTPEIVGRDPISEMVEIPVNGTSQTLLIRGQDASNPVVLFLHGGPGTSAIPLNNDVMSLIEREYVHVNWDQRASGKSYERGTSFEDVTLETYDEDIMDVVSYLRERFDEERVILVGHSWGSAIGVRFAAKHPELLHAYIGMGQLLNIPENGKRSMEYVLDAARQDGNEQALEELEPIANAPGGLSRAQIITQRKWLDHYGGSTRAGSTIGGFLRRAIFSTPEFTLGDTINVIRASLEQIRALGDEIGSLRLDEEIRRIEVPVFFFLGRHDHQTPSSIAEEFAAALEAPSVEIVWFEESAHAPFVEQPTVYQERLLAALDQVPTLAGR